MQSSVRKVMIKMVCVGLLAIPAAMFAQNRLAPPASDDRSWRPDASNRAAYQSIVDLNIFLPDRSGLAQRFEQQNTPPNEPTPTPGPGENTPPQPPPNPDRDLVLRGTSLRGDIGYVFIEDLTTGQTTRLQVPCDYAQGQLTDITLDGVTYTPDEGQPRQLTAGQTLTGETAPRGSSIARRAGEPDQDDPDAGSTEGGTSSEGENDGLSELERRLRERRLRGE